MEGRTISAAFSEKKPTGPFGTISAKRVVSPPAINRKNEERMLHYRRMNLIEIITILVSGYVHVRCCVCTFCSFKVKAVLSALLCFSFSLYRYVAVGCPACSLVYAVSMVYASFLLDRWR